jgi:hypothetical protein
LIYTKSNGSWGSGVNISSTVSAYPNVELNIANNSSQQINSLSGTANFDTLFFSGSNNIRASLTGGNSWNGTTFTVGGTGAGWYQFSTQVVGVTNTGGETIIGVAHYLDVNQVGTPICISTYDQYTNGANAGLRNSTKINCMMYLDNGNTVRFRAQSWSTTTAAFTSTNGTTHLSITRIK